MEEPAWFTSYIGALRRKKGGGKTSRLPMDRMPFGLMQHQMEFFHAIHVCQVIFVVFTTFLWFICEKIMGRLSQQLKKNMIDNIMY